MHLTRLALTDFRSYATADLPLEPGVTTLRGPNGEGKTNLAEAIGYAATLGSHRVATDAPLVRHGANRAIIRAAVTASRGSSLVEIELNPGKANRVRLNRAPLPRPREILGVLRTVLFAPEDLALVKGDPEQRRRFLDDLLVSMAPRYAAVRADYDRVVRQRTALLKSAGLKPVPAPSQRGARGAQARHGGHERHGGHGRPGSLPGSMAATLDAWDGQLARAGAELLAGRAGLVAALRPHVEAAYAAVSGGRGPAGICYRTSFPMPGGCPAAGSAPVPPPAEIEAAMLGALARSRRDELDRGVCLVGPHRDELEIRIGEMPARGYASQGESWSLALALRLAAYEILRAGGEDPVLVLDDVFAELDARRREKLAVLVAGAEQVVVTAAVPADVPAVLSGARFDIAGGVITRAA